MNESGRLTMATMPNAADALLSLSLKQISKNIDSALHTFDDPTLKMGSRVVPVEELVFRLATQQHRILWAGKFAAEIDGTQDESQAGCALGNRLGQGLLKAVAKDVKRRP